MFLISSLISYLFPISSPQISKSKLSVRHYEKQYGLKTKLLSHLFVPDKASFLFFYIALQIARLCIHYFSFQDHSSLATSHPASSSLRVHATLSKRLAKQPVENIILFSSSYCLLTKLTFLHKAQHRRMNVNVLIYFLIVFSPHT